MNGQGEDRTILLPQCSQLRSSLQVPEANGLIHPGDHGSSTIGHKGHCIDRKAAAGDEPLEFPALHIPQGHYAIIAAAEKLASIRREDHNIDVVLVPF